MCLWGAVDQLGCMWTRARRQHRRLRHNSTFLLFLWSWWLVWVQHVVEQDLESQIAHWLRCVCSITCVVWAPGHVCSGVELSIVTQQCTVVVRWDNAVVYRRLCALSLSSFVCCWQGRSQKLHVGGPGARGLILLLSVCSLLRSYLDPSPYFPSKINKYIRSIGEIFKRFRVYTTSQSYSVLLQEMLIFLSLLSRGPRPPDPPLATPLAADGEIMNQTHTTWWQLICHIWLCKSFTYLFNSKAYEI